jgi:hypothetical protein
MAFCRWLVRCATATGNVGSCGAAGYRQYNEVADDLLLFAEF